MDEFDNDSDDGFEYGVEGETLVTRRVLNSKLKKMTWNNKGKISFILTALSSIRYVVSS